MNPFKQVNKKDTKKVKNVVEDIIDKTTDDIIDKPTDDFGSYYSGQGGGFNPFKTNVDEGDTVFERAVIKGGGGEVDIASPSNGYEFDKVNKAYQQGSTMESLFGEDMFKVDGDKAVPTGAFGKQVERVLGKGVTGKTEVGEQDLFKLMDVLGDENKLGPMAKDNQLKPMGGILEEIEGGFTESYKSAYDGFKDNLKNKPDGGINVGDLYQGVFGEAAEDNMDLAKELGETLGIDTSKEGWLGKVAGVGDKDNFREKFGKVEALASSYGITSDDVNINDKNFNDANVLFRDLNSERLGREATEKANGEASGILSKYMGGERATETDNIFNAVTGRDGMGADDIKKASQLQTDINSVKESIEGGKVTDRSTIDAYNKYKGISDYESVDASDGADGYFKPRKAEEKVKEVLQFDDFGGMDKNIDINSAMDKSPSMAEGNSNLKDIYDAKKAGIDVGADGDKILERAYQIDKAGVGKGEKAYAEFQNAANNYNTDDIKLASKEGLEGLDDLTGSAVTKNGSNYQLNDGFIKEANGLKDLSDNEKALLNHKGPIQTQQQLDTLTGLEDRASNSYFDSNLENTFGKDSKASDKALGEIMGEVKGIEGGIGKHGSSVEDIASGHLGIGKGERNGRVSHGDVSNVLEKVKGGAEVGDLSSKEKSILGSMKGIGKDATSTQDRLIGNMSEDVMDEIIGNQSNRYKNRGRNASMQHKKNIVTEILGLDTMGTNSGGKKDALRSGAHQGYDIKMKDLKGKDLEKAQKRLAESNNMDEVMDLFDIKERRGLKGTYGNMRAVNKATSTAEGSETFAKDLDDAIESARKGDVRVNNTRKSMEGVIGSLEDSDVKVSDKLLKSMNKFADGDDLLSLGKHVNKNSADAATGIKGAIKKASKFKTTGKIAGGITAATIGVGVIGSMFSNASEERERKDQELAMMIGNKNSGGY